jgi:CRP-like cAMP-binding protein
MLSTRKTFSVYSVFPPFQLGETLAKLHTGGQRNLARLSATHDFPAGSTIFDRETFPASVWIVISGKSRLTFPQGSHPRDRSRRIGPNDVCGLTETLAGVPFQATLKAVTDCTCRNLSGSALDEFLRSEPAICTALLGALARDYYKGYLKLLSAA